MVYTVQLKRQAAQKLKSLPANERTRIVDKIDELAMNPDSAKLNVKLLAGSSLYRLRIGKWRIIFARLDTLKILSIEKLGARGDIYK